MRISLVNRQLAPNFCVKCMYQYIRIANHNFSQNFLSCVWTGLQAWNTKRKYFPSHRRKGRRLPPITARNVILSLTLKADQFVLLQSLNYYHYLYGLCLHICIWACQVSHTCFFNTIRLHLPPSTMATESERPRPLASILLFLNLVLYIIVAAIAGWALNYSMDETPYTS